MNPIRNDGPILLPGAPAVDSSSAGDVGMATGDTGGAAPLDALVTPSGMPSIAAQNQLSGAPPVVSTPRPANYAQALQSADHKLANSAPISSTLGAAIIAGENGSDAKWNKLISSGGKSDPAAAQKRQDQTKAQAESILSSAEEPHKKGCSKKPPNHDELVYKAQMSGLSKGESSALVRVLEDRRTPPDTKEKLAFQLAALGMSGAGFANSQALAGNASGVRKELSEMGASLEGQYKKMDKARAVGHAAGIVTFGISAVLADSKYLDQSGKLVKGAADDVNAMHVASFTSEPTGLPTAGGGTLGEVAGNDVSFTAPMPAGGPPDKLGAQGLLRASIDQAREVL